MIYIFNRIIGDRVWNLLQYSIFMRIARYSGQEHVTYVFLTIWLTYTGAYRANEMLRSLRGKRLAVIQPVIAIPDNQLTREFNPKASGACVWSPRRRMGGGSKSLTNRRVVPSKDMQFGSHQFCSHFHERYAQC